MTEPEYRIDYTLLRRRDGEDDFTEIGFGASSAAGSVDSAAYDVESQIENRLWETQGDMPDPDEA